MSKVDQTKKNQSEKNQSESVLEKTVDALDGTEAGKIWNEIKDKNIEMFALPNQKINQYCQPRLVEPTKLYLITNATSVLPSLEAAVGKDYSVELAGKYLIVSRSIKSSI